MKGDVTLELTSADITGALAAMYQAGVVLKNVVYIDELTVRLTVSRQDHKEAGRIAERRGETLKQIARLGLYWKYRMIFRHPVLIGGLLLLIALTLWLPTRVLFIQVEGNDSVPTKLILEKAADCGIVFGAERQAIRSEKLKNALLDALPQLQWAGVNTYGCVAVISIEERAAADDSEVGFTGSIVAVRDGIITECTAVRGTSLCKVGQAVLAGQVLISGYVDCGGVILDMGAEGEVYAETRWELQAVTPPEASVREDFQREEIKISLIIGKNRINFFEDSGILDSSCVKMYSEYYMTLPGGFRLPVCLAVERWTWYRCAAETIEPETAAKTLLDYSATYLQTQMIAGQILERREYTNGSMLYANYICREMIGQNRYEEIIDKYGENYGKNS